MNRPTRLVSFSGIDGAGKSTQIQALRDRIAESGLRVRVIAFWDEVARLTRFRESAGHRIFKGEKGVGTPSAPVNRRDKNVRSRFMTCVRYGLYAIDALSLRILAKKALRSDYDVLIFDRYIYDELANLDLDNQVSQFYVKLLMKFVPKPDISYLLDADPLQARTRKPEYPIDFLQLNRLSYLSICRLLGGITVIDPMPIGDVEQAILKHLSIAPQMRPASSSCSTGISSVEERASGENLEAAGPHRAAS